MRAPKSAIAKSTAVLLLLVVVLAIFAGVAWVKLPSTGEIKTVVLTQTVTSQPPAKLTFAVDFAAQGYHAMFYSAVDLGYYQEVGLTVEIVHSRGSALVVQQVDKGDYDLGFADLGTAAVLRSKGAQVKAVGAVMHLSPIATYYLPESGIKSPKDLEGKTIADNPASSTVVLFPAFAALAGFDDQKVKIINVDITAREKAVLAKQTDASDGFLPSVVPVFVSAGRQDVKYFRWADYGFTAYGNVILTSDKTLAQKADVIKRFLAATYKAIEWTAQNPEKAVDILLKYKPELRRDESIMNLKLALELFGDKLKTEHGTRLGLFDPKKAADTTDLIGKYIKFDSPVRPDDIYTNSLL